VLYVQHVAIKQPETQAQLNTSDATEFIEQTPTMTTQKSADFQITALQTKHSERSADLLVVGLHAADEVGLRLVERVQQPDQLVAELAAQRGLRGAFLPSWDTHSIQGNQGRTSRTLLSVASYRRQHCVIAWRHYGKGPESPQLGPHTIQHFFTERTARYITVFANAQLLKTT
jgi:hypothetical protein